MEFRTPTRNFPAMDELQIARSTADVLHRLSGGSGATGAAVDAGSEGSGDRKECAGSEGRQLATLKANTIELAVARANAATRDFGAVLTEVELEIGFQLARILAGTIDPVLAGLEIVEARKGEVCSICQQEMEGEDSARATECRHKFHALCIVKWLREKMTCPLCRYKMELGNKT